MQAEEDQTSSNPNQLGGSGPGGQHSSLGSSSLGQGLSGDSSLGMGDGGAQSRETRLYHCNQALTSMYTFIDGEMPSIDRSQLQHHLEQCAPCLEAFEFEAELKLVVSQRCKEEVPPAFVAKLTEVLKLQIQADQASGAKKPSAS